MDLRGLSGPARAELSFLASRVPEVFEVNEARKVLNLPNARVTQKLASWTKSGYLSRIKRGTYIQIPMNIENPMNWFGDDFRVAISFWPNSYFTGWTAANHWGLTEQVFRTVVVKTSDRVRSNGNKGLREKFMTIHVAKLDTSWGINTEWRDGYKISYADPARTIAEILAQPELGGGIRLVVEMLDTYLHDYEATDLVNAVTRLNKGTACKRLGYLLEVLNFSDHKTLEYLALKVTKGITLLDPAGGDSGERKMRWNLRINANVERSNS